MRCGIDIVQISRIEDMACRHERSLGKFFTEAELAYCRRRQRQQYASRWPGYLRRRRLFSRPWGTGFRQGKWTDVEVSHTELGAPVFILHGYYKEAAAAICPTAPALSVSHDGDYAVAQVVMEGYIHKEEE